jgi:Transposase and inactivated derivatives
MATHRNHVLLERRRRKAAALFERNVPVAEVARRLSVASQVIYRWRQAWEKGGEQALASKGPAGPKSRLTEAQANEVVAALLQGPLEHGYKTQLWTLPRVARLIKDLTGVQYHPGHVWRILGSLGFSCQRPERRAIERDEQAIQQWKRVHWPAIKKKRSNRAAKSSLSTKAV